MLDVPQYKKVAINRIPKPRKSPSQLAESGTLQKNLGRYQARITAQTTVIAPIGTAPRISPQLSVSVWADVMRNAPSGLLTKSDRVAFEVLVRLTVRMRTLDAKTSELNSRLAVLAKFGMNPTDCLKLNLDPLPEPTAQTEEQRRWAELDELDYFPPTRI